MSNRVVCFVDGFNVYHSLKDNYRRFLWLNYHALAERFVTKNRRLVKVYYFTSLAYWLPDSERRHKTLLRALEYAGVTTVLGHFKGKTRKCGAICGQYYLSHEEKRTDVNLALHLYRSACLNEYDTAIVMSADSDFVPAIRMVKQDFPLKTLAVVFPLDIHSNDLAKLKEIDFIWRTKKSDLSASQFANPLILPDGTVLHRPPSWA